MKVYQDQALTFCCEQMRRSWNVDVESYENDRIRQVWEVTTTEGYIDPMNYCPWCGQKIEILNEIEEESIIAP
jgi:hypothetical protein